MLSGDATQFLEGVAVTWLSWWPKAVIPADRASTGAPGDGSTRSTPGALTMATGTAGAEEAGMTVTAAQRVTPIILNNTERFSCVMFASRAVVGDFDADPAAAVPPRYAATPHGSYPPYL
jgi:hypothetical protein